VIAAMSGIALVGGAAVLFFRHIRTETISSDAADSRISEVRARFSGQQPLLRIAGDGSPEIAGRSDRHDSHAPLVSLRVLAYDPDRGRLADIRVPFWLLRLAPDGRVSFTGDNGVRFRADRLHVNLAALEAVGPGLVLDHAESSGTRLLVWTE
jgi:hypothetical protein